MKAIIGLALLTSVTAFADTTIPINPPEPKIIGAPIAPPPLPPVVRVAPLPRNCLMYQAMIERLGKKYGEYSAFRGITEGGRSLKETFINVKTGSYTDLIITPKKSELVACIIGSGTGGVLLDASIAHTI